MAFANIQDNLKFNGQIFGEVGNIVKVENYVESHDRKCHFTSFRTDFHYFLSLKFTYGRGF